MSAGFWLSAVLQVDAARRHLDEQVGFYGETSLVSLVNHKGHEQPVKEAYEHEVAQVMTFARLRLITPHAHYDQQLNHPKVRYQYFDFHNECKHMRWDRISVLIDKMEEDLVKQG